MKITADSHLPAAEYPMFYLCVLVQSCSDPQLPFDSSRIMTENRK